MSNYNVVAVKTGDPAIISGAEDDVRGLYVIRNSTNKSVRKALAEIGFVSNPNDFNAVTGNEDLVASQLAQGIENNIEKHFFTEGKVIGYIYNGTEYRSMDDIPYPSRQNQNLPAFFRTLPTADELFATKSIHEKVPLTKITY
jgi:hypothetical protein